MKIIQNNDSRFDEEDPNNRKPTIREKDVVDKDVKPSEWYKPKKQSEEQPPIRDILDYELLGHIFKDVPEFSTQIATSLEQMINAVYAKFHPIFMDVKNKQLEIQKAKENKQKEELQVDLQKSLFQSKSMRSTSRNNTELQPPLQEVDAESFNDEQE